MVNYANKEVSSLPFTAKAKKPAYIGGWYFVAIIKPEIFAFKQFLKKKNKEKEKKKKRKFLGSKWFLGITLHHK